MNLLRLVAGLLVFSQSAIAQEGPFAPAADLDGSTAMHADSSVFMHWMDHCEVEVAYQNIADSALGFASVGDEFSCLGYPGENGVLSLGDGGVALLSFDGILFNGEGHDFAVFENSFSDTYLELAHVEVSSDGQNFFRFPSQSLHESDSQVGPFGLIDPTYICNLAGKYRALYGTPFDLEELDGINDLDINAITHIKIIDAIGSIDEEYGSLDALGNIINDPYPTEFASSGFDLDAIGLIHWDNLTHTDEKALKAIQIYPNPFNEYLIIAHSEEELNYQVFDMMGRVMMKGDLKHEKRERIDTSALKPGCYFIQLSNTDVYTLIKN